MKIGRLDTTELKPVNMEGAERVFKQVPISKADGSPTFSFRVFTIEPGGHTPYHKHESEHVNYVIEGNGAIVNKDGEEAEFNKGNFALVLPGEVHQYKNKSENQPFIMICAVPKEYE